MECPFCGFRIPPYARACPNCSAPIPSSVRKQETKPDAEAGKKTRGPDQNDRGIVQKKTAVPHRDRGQLKEAEAAFKRALSIQEKDVADGLLRLAQTLSDYATLLRDMKRDKEAEALDARAKEIKAKNK